MNLHTSKFVFSQDQANRYSKTISKKHGCYFTAIKGEPFDKNDPDFCFAITNRFDPQFKLKA